MIKSKLTVLLPLREDAAETLGIAYLEPSFSSNLRRIVSIV